MHREQDRRVILAMLTTHLQTEAEQWFSENAHLILGEGERVVAYAAIVTEKKKGKEKSLYARPEPMKIRITHGSFKLLYPAMVSQQRLSALKQVLPNDAYKFIETLLLKFSNQSTNYKELLAETFEKRTEDEYPNRFLYSSDAKLYFKQLFSQLGIRDLRLQVGIHPHPVRHWIVQLWTIEPQEDPTKCPK